MGMWGDGVVKAMYRNRNRGYQQLRVWQDAIDLYVGVCRVFRGWAYEKGLESKRDREASDRIDRVRESNVLYGSPIPPQSILPTPQYPNPPTFPVTP